MPSSRDRERPAIVAFHKLLLDEVQALPGVSAASISYGLPYLGLRGGMAVTPSKAAIRQRRAKCRPS